MLLNKKKFDIRLWVLVQDFCPPRIWVYDECYIRMCATDFTSSNLDNRFIHLTNNCV
jgi:tubulin monoglycylase TTLL3/8